MREIFLSFAAGAYGLFCLAGLAQIFGLWGARPPFRERVRQLADSVKNEWGDNAEPVLLSIIRAQQIAGNESDARLWMRVEMELAGRRRLTSQPASPSSQAR